MKLEVKEFLSAIKVNLVIFDFDASDVFSRLPEYFFQSFVSHSNSSYTFYIPLKTLNEHLPVGVKPVVWIWSSFIDAFYLTISSSVN